MESASTLNGTVMIVIGVALMSRKYFAMRRGKEYARDRLPVRRSQTTFGKSNNLKFFTMVGVTLAAMWFDWSVLLKFHDSDILHVLGPMFALSGCLLIVWSLKQLGRNYSPCYDSYQPHEIVMQGPYKLIRHPLYAGNLLLGIGFVVASGSLWVLLSFLYSSRFFFKAMREEEADLGNMFPGYRDYLARTWRLFPFVY